MYDSYAMQVSCLDNALCPRVFAAATAACGEPSAICTRLAVLPDACNTEDCAKNSASILFCESAIITLVSLNSHLLKKGS
jgi:hypothetical protein